jgi:hypothetical protein
MRKKKRRIKTYKNWLLARDSASRISTKPSYMGFLEGKDENQEDKNDNPLLFRSPRLNR